jgi:hypothetical protein
MTRSKPRPITGLQANILIGEVGLVALSALMAIGGSVASWVKLRHKAAEVIDQVA